MESNKEVPAAWPEPRGVATMFERTQNPTSGEIELIEVEWYYDEEGNAKKKVLGRVGIEPPPASVQTHGLTKVHAIYWATGCTMGNIAVFSPEVLGSFPDAAAGDGALLACNMIEAGKFRNGASRLWCTVHQCHWGRKADLVDKENHGVVRCASWSMPMSYVKNPQVVDIRDAAEVAVWCSLPPALSSRPIVARPPRIHVHIRRDSNGPKELDSDFPAVALVHEGDMTFFGHRGIKQIHVTPPAALEYLRSVEEGRKMDCVDCNSCGFPHLDLGNFAEVPHKKHACGNCGRDSTWSDGPVISNPLKRLFDEFSSHDGFVGPGTELNLDDYEGFEYDVWASTPAIVWTGSRPQEKGIHVHVWNGNKEIVNDTFQVVRWRGKRLDRAELLDKMLSTTAA